MKLEPLLLGYVQADRWYNAQNLWLIAGVLGAVVLWFIGY